MPDTPITILLAEDDEDDLFFFHEALSHTTINGKQAKEAVKIVPVSNGLHVLDYLKKAQKDLLTDPLPNVIILDLNMPILNGLNTLREIKGTEALENIPVFILTTSKDERQKKECEALGCAGFFSKTADVQVLQSIIEHIMAAA